MNESQIEDGLRNIALLEPVLGFDPDEVATRAAKRQKTRSMALAAGVAAVVIGLMTVGMVVVGSKGGAVPPAVHDTVTPLERNKRHFGEVGPKVIAEVRNFAIVDTEYSHYVGNPQGSLLIGAGFHDRHGVGKVYVGISDSLPKSQGYPTPEECRPGSSNTHHGQCRLITLRDESMVVVASNSGLPDGTTMGAVAIHHREDGTYVVVTISSGVTKPGSEVLKPTAVAEGEVVALATDPAFTLR